MATIAMIVAAATGYAVPQHNVPGAAPTLKGKLHKFDVFAPDAAEPSFEAFKALYGKVYTAAEEPAKAVAYAANVVYFEAHNAKYTAGESTFYMGVNEYSDLTHAEFKALLVGPKIPIRNATQVEWLEAPALAAVDWRSQGAVTPVKNQGQCGSCWSFSTTGAVEGAVKIATGKLTSVSEQQLMDCSRGKPGTGDNSCEGAYSMNSGFEYIIKNGGIDSDADYPYKARDEACDQVREARKVSNITAFKDVTPSSEAQLAVAVSIGPVSVLIDANSSAFLGYKGGILTGGEDTCGLALDHAVLAVGYGTDGGTDYWIVKNSWGTVWGDQGYVRIGKGTATTAGECGIALGPTYAIVGGPESEGAALIAGM